MVTITVWIGYTLVVRWTERLGCWLSLKQDIYCGSGRNRHPLPACLACSTCTKHVVKPACHFKSRLSSCAHALSAKSKNRTFFKHNKKNSIFMRLFKKQIGFVDIMTIFVTTEKNKYAVLFKNVWQRAYTVTPLGREFWIIGKQKQLRYLTDWLINVNGIFIMCLFNTATSSIS